MQIYCCEDAVEHQEGKEHPSCPLQVLKLLATVMKRDGRLVCAPYQPERCLLLELAITDGTCANVDNQVFLSYWGKLQGKKFPV